LRKLKRQESQFSFWPWDIINNPPFQWACLFCWWCNTCDDCCWEESAQGLYFTRKGIMLREREREIGSNTLLLLTLL
jgi:hypothetical protein